MNKVFTPEQICELVKFVFEASVYRPSWVEKRIIEWLEQNQPAPQVVGLSDEQIESLSVSLKMNNLSSAYRSTTEKSVIKEWLKTQTFTHQPELVVAGLSDEQIYSLHDYLHNNWSNNSFLDCYHKWAKTQAFAQPDKLLERQYNETMKELEQLKLQKFAPNWDDAPEWANWWAQDSDGQWRWFELEPTVMTNGYLNDSDGKQESVTGFIKNWKQSLQQRPQLKDSNGCHD
jgi:hypothetical protein